MKCIVTAGPTYEPLDEVRRLTNFSTGRLGSLLADYLAACGHEVGLFLGYYSIHRGSHPAQVTVQTFTTTADLRSRLQQAASASVQAVFHAAAVSDFTFGQIEVRPPNGTPQAVTGRKLSSRQGPLWVELQPAPKIIADLRTWFPQASVVGWKYEVEGDQKAALVQGNKQIAECQTQACVVNGPAYGDGFALVTGQPTARHLADAQQLYAALEQFFCRES